MNILLINYEFPPLGAGASTATWHIGKELSAMGNDVTVLTSSFKTRIGYEKKESMTIFRCPAIRKKVSQSNMLEMMSFVISAFCFLPWIVLKHHIGGVIVFFSFPCGPLGLWANLLFKIPYVVSLRGGDVPGTEKQLDKIHKILKPFRRHVFRKSKAVIANSEGLKALAQKADTVSIKVIPNGVDNSFYTPAPFIKPSCGFNVLFVGRFSEQKNLEFLIEQTALLIQKENVPIRLHIAGDGPLKSKIKEWAEKVSLDNDISWYGWVAKEEILTLCQKSDCFVNPSFYEGMPNAVLEAMACGLPVVASNVAGNDAVVTNGHNGFLFDVGDGEKFRYSIKCLFEDKKLCADMGKNAIKTVNRYFSWRYTADTYSALF